MKEWLEPTTHDVFFSKNDPLDPRLGDIVLSAEWSQIDSEIKKGDVVILSYPDDDGVKNNRGRVGTKLGPQSIKKSFYKMTPGYNSLFKSKIYDIGNLKLDGTINERHLRAQSIITGCLARHAKILTLGGGNDYAFPDLAGFCTWAALNQKKPFIINFDAHLDVRSDEKNINSGTAFYRLLNQFPDMHFFEVGIQNWCNSKYHMDWAKGKGATVITLDDIFSHKYGLFDLMHKKVFKKFNPKKHMMAISIDIDGFSSSEAPGASQVFPTGLQSKDFLPMIKRIVEKYSPQLFSIYEVNPSYDLDQRTATLAALIAHYAIYSS